jgi:hypothetical protein
VTAQPDGWLRTVCSQCGAECLMAKLEDGSSVMLNARPVRMFAEHPTLGGAMLTNCYTPHAVTCDYRGRR